MTSEHNIIDRLILDLLIIQSVTTLVSFTLDVRGPLNFYLRDIEMYLGM